MLESSTTKHFSHSPWPFVSEVNNRAELENLFRIVFVCFFVSLVAHRSSLGSAVMDEQAIKKRIEELREELLANEQEQADIKMKSGPVEAEQLAMRRKVDSLQNPLA